MFCHRHLCQSQWHHFIATNADTHLFGRTDSAPEGVFSAGSAINPFKGHSEQKQRDILCKLWNTHKVSAATAKYSNDNIEK